MKKTIIILSIISLGILMVTPVLADDYEDPDPILPDSASTDDFNIPNPLGKTGNISVLISNIINFLIKLAVPITAILIVYAGYLYITSAGNEQKIKTAQKALIWALVGFAVVLIASSVPAIIQEFLSGKPTTTTTTNTLPPSFQI